MLQNANNGISGFMEDSQYLPLVASFSLILISLQDSAGSSGMEPSGTKQDQIRLQIDDKPLLEALINNIQLTSVDPFSEIISVCVKNEIFRCGFFGSITELTHEKT